MTQYLKNWYWRSDEPMAMYVCKEGQEKIAVPIDTFHSEKYPELSK